MNDTEINKSCFFTGHRILKREEAGIIMPEVKRICIDLIENHGVDTFISGGAIGFDTLAAELILELKKRYNHIRLYMYLPCIDQSENWNISDIKKWKNLLRKADDYVFVTNSPYTNGCMQKRNRAMVDNARFGIAFCKRSFGGTYSTITYAAKLGRQITVLP